MLLKDFIKLIEYGDCELDLKVAYDNEYGEEITLCRTFVSEKMYDPDKMYWAEDRDRVIRYGFCFPTEKVERYADFSVDMLKAENRNHFFVLACKWMKDADETDR